MSQWPHMSDIIPQGTGETLIVFPYGEFCHSQNDRIIIPLWNRKSCATCLIWCLSYRQVSAQETQKSIYSQTNPSPPPSCCIQVDIWPIISPSVEETCGHLMTPTGVMHAVAQDDTMTVSFNISLYILCEMTGTCRSAVLFTDCRGTTYMQWGKVGHVLDQCYLKLFPCKWKKKNLYFYMWFNS